MADPKGPQLIFGTATFGMDKTESQDAASVRKMLETIQELGISRLDTGARYPPRSPGRSEELIGETRELSQSFVVDTKIYTDSATDGSGDLTPRAIDKSIDASLKRLRRPEGVDILYVHRADPLTPLEDQIKGFQEQINAGHCKKWGISNMPPDTLAKLLSICDEKGLPKPVCYQGDYNVMTRGMETKLLPLLRAHGMTFNAYRPLAAGFLTGSAVNNEVAGTRFAKDNPLGNIMQSIFSANGIHAAMLKFDAAVKSKSLTPLEVAVRWIVHHSALKEGDGVILGASKTHQIQQTVAFIKKGPLPDEIITLTDELWGDVKESRGTVL